MARAILIGSGGGSADLDEITAVAGDVVKGKVIVDQNGNALTGTLELTGNATASQVLNNRTFYTTNPKSKQTGSMPDRAAQTASLNCGQSAIILQGYHNGSGKITANSLASQTSGTAKAGKILRDYTAWVNGTKITGTIIERSSGNAVLDASESLQLYSGYYPSDFTVKAASLASQTSATASSSRIMKGYTAWVNGTKITGIMDVQSAISFSAAPYGIRKAMVTWTNPSKGPFLGVRIYIKDSNGNKSIKYTGIGSSAIAGGKSSATITLGDILSRYTLYAQSYYFYSLPNDSGPTATTTYTVLSSEVKIGDITTSTGTFTFTSSQTWQKPSNNVWAAEGYADICLVGGGGGGAGSKGRGDNSVGWVNSGGGGAGGELIRVNNVPAPPDSRWPLAITVGAGGAGGHKGLQSAGNIGYAGDGARGGESRVKGNKHNYNQNALVAYGGGGGKFWWNISGAGGAKPVATGGGAEPANEGEGHQGSNGGGAGNYPRANIDLKGTYGGSNYGNGEDSGTPGTTSSAGISSKGGRRGTSSRLVPNCDSNYWANSASASVFTTLTNTIDNGIYYCGGGAGGPAGYQIYASSSYNGSGGLGGGGNSYSHKASEAGEANTGGGGGGAGCSESNLTASPPLAGAAGGSGVIIMRFHN